jgi:hypothetical protein
MLPDTRQVREPQIDHLNFFIRNRLEEIVYRCAIRNHDLTPNLSAAP